MSIGDRFKAIRETLGLNQSELARSIDAHPSIISDIERESKEPSKKVISAMIVKYRINSNWLLTAQGDMYIKDASSPKSRLEQELHETMATHPKFSEIETRLSAIESILKKNVYIYDTSIGNNSPLHTAEKEPEYDAREWVKVLYVDDIAAGPPISQSEDQTQFVWVPARLVKNGFLYYAASIRGSSMAEAGIRDGDMVLIRHTDEPRDRAIQVVRYDGKSTIKRLREIEGKGWELHYEDGSGKVIPANSVDYQVQGEFVAILPENTVQTPSKKPLGSARAL